jgi:hypothetical protein
MHVQVDSPPYVLEDEIGLRLAGPETAGGNARTWTRGAPVATERQSWPVLASSRTSSPNRPATASRNTSSSELGLDTFAQRRPEIASRLRVFEVDQPGPQAWKRRRLIDLGFGIPEWLRLVAVDSIKAPV